MYPISGFSVSPLSDIGTTIIVSIVYTIIAFIIGNIGKIYEYKILHHKLFFIFPVTLFIFPSFLEEFFFRAIVIHPYFFTASLIEQTVIIFISSITFTLWHPLNAYLFNKSARKFFYNTYFLSITFVLGICCAFLYISSESIWAPIILHWLTVVIWVFFLGGRNLLKEKS